MKDIGIDTNGLNGNISDSEAATVEELFISNKGINSLTWIEILRN